MCGITGFFSANVVAAPERLIQDMTDTLRRRGPDDGGVWLNDSCAVALGHRRLSIIDTSCAGHQPMASASGRYVLVYNGEIYNHRGLREQLRAAGQAPPRWRGHSDTETLLACIDAWGFEQTLQSANGMFAMAVWDKERGLLLLARDRMGEKPLYYGWQGDTFLFGSELKALRAHPAFRNEIDRGALALFLRHNCVPAPYSIYSGIGKLPAGSWLAISDGKRAGSPVAYWRLSTVAEAGTAGPLQVGDDEAVDQLERILLSAVRGQMVADVPLGALLSGGVDSSAICALMQASARQPVNTFTIGFSEAGYNEAAHARAVARHLGTNHTDMCLSGRDALTLVPALPEIWDEPFADSSQLPTHLLMQLARRHVTVALSGDGGDELFAGYNRHLHVPRLMRRLSRVPAPLRRLAGALLTSLPAAAMNNGLSALAAERGISQPGDKAHKLGKLLRGADFSSSDSLYTFLLSEWTDPVALLTGGYLPANLVDDRAAWPRLDDPVARMMVIDALSYLPDDILVKVDRAAMAVSLETRAPFLDPSVVDFAWRLPMDLKQRDGQGKWLLRRLLDRYVPRELIDRPKMGFSIPLDLWLRGPLRDWAEHLLAENRLAGEGFFQPAPIRAAWQNHCSGRANYGHGLWSVLMFQAWLETR
jgi:asparagine synthase (glutamine-hydrolysing)